MSYVREGKDVVIGLRERGESHKSYRDRLIESLRDPKEAIAYARAGYEESDETLGTILKDIAEAYATLLLSAQKERVKELEQADETRVRDICRLTEERDTLESSLAQAREALKKIKRGDIRQGEMVRIAEVALAGDSGKGQ